MRLFKFTFLLLTALLISQKQTKAMDFVDLQQQEDLGTITEYIMTCSNQEVRDLITGYLLDNPENNEIPHLYDWETFDNNHNIRFVFDGPLDENMILLEIISLTQHTGTFYLAH